MERSNSITLSTASKHMTIFSSQSTEKTISRPATSSSSKPSLRNLPAVTTPSHGSMSRTFPSAPAQTPPTFSTSKSWGLTTQMKGASNAAPAPTPAPPPPAPAQAAP